MVCRRAPHRGGLAPCRRGAVARGGALPCCGSPARASEGPGRGAALPRCLSAAGGRHRPVFRRSVHACRRGGLWLVWRRGAPSDEVSPLVHVAGCDGGKPQPLRRLLRSPQPAGVGAHQLAPCADGRLHAPSRRRQRGGGPFGPHERAVSVPSPDAPFLADGRGSAPVVRLGLPAAPPRALAGRRSSVGRPRLARHAAGRRRAGAHRG